MEDSSPTVHRSPSRLAHSRSSGRCNRCRGGEQDLVAILIVWQEVTRCASPALRGTQRSTGMQTRMPDCRSADRRRPAATHRTVTQRIPARIRQECKYWNVRGKKCLNREPSQHTAAQTFFSSATSGFSHLGCCYLIMGTTRRADVRSTANQATMSCLWWSTEVVPAELVQLDREHACRN